MLKSCQNQMVEIDETTVPTTSETTETTNTEKSRFSVKGLPLEACKDKKSSQ